MSGLTNQTVLAHFSIRGANWPDRVAAIAAAGFSGVGLSASEYVRLQDSGWTDEAMLTVLANHGMRVIELEVVRFFSDDLGVFDRIIAAFRPERLQVVPPFDGPCDHARAATWLREVADRYAPYGVTLGIEFLGCSAIDSAPLAVELARMADRPNVKLCVDSWHVFRGRGLASLDGLDPSMVAAIQINDGPMEPVLDAYIPDCLHHRCTMGEGEFDLAGFLARLPSEVPLSVEVIDDDLDLLPTAVVADRLYRSLVDTLAPV